MGSKACAPRTLAAKIDVMTPEADFFMVFVTTPTVDVARDIAQAALRARLAACAQLIPGFESHYWWQGALESQKETLLVFKTVRSQLTPLRALVLERHPYDVPEFVATAIEEGSPAYLKWMDSETNPANPR